MRILVVWAHPLADSYSAALKDRAVAALEATGHEVDLLDLYAEEFDPALSAQERIDYHDLELNIANIRPYVEQLRAAEGLLLVFPTWSFGFPAILTGWLQRVWVPGVAFGLREDGGPIIPGILGIRRVAAVTTTGSPWWYVKAVGNPARKVLKRGHRVMFAKRARTKWLDLNNMNKDSPRKRARFLAKVERTLPKFFSG
ncbi:MAG: NAD(P)H-dependent oxidoreductase [Acidimicrobiia bacterium]|nr:NAD(P)H-dependent oxidoreductase [bacterium]MXX01248.1 NAD(P)H-dependent oxidoreductase [Acidimicrobiia bacterium]MXX44758.1 NAD(P)H-dependent oxidoreductase [Acidimicrobiia bacterium]MXY75167.1 NAD(P)H-dependent oxidoreductase [Acidimicrobiia bacterium]MYA39715.1 NAD(P)H-dependent oxidoreductase [Acidimicrobiia bacterium]